MKPKRDGPVIVLLILGAVMAWSVLHEHTSTEPDALGASPLRRAASAESGTDVGPLPQTELPVPVSLDESQPAERVELPAKGTQSRDLTLSIEHACGTPAAGATVLLASEGRLLAKGRTDNRGKVTLGPTPAESLALAPCELILGGVSDVPELLRLDGIEDQQRIVLQEGMRIEGRIIIDGAAPTEPVLLSIQSLPRKREHNVPEGALSSALYVSVPGQATGSLFNAQVIEAGGHFEFSGLPPDWNGRFTLHRSFVPESGPDALLVRAPTLGVELRVKRPVTVLGRVVEPGGHRAVGFAAIRFRWHRSRGDLASAFVCDADGRFQIPLELDADSVDLRIQHPEGNAFRMLQWATDALLRNGDVGDIELLAARPPLFFRVVDGQGGPVHGAVARSEDPLSSRSLPTDEQGLGELRGVTPDTPGMTVWAHRYAIASVELSGLRDETSAENPMVVVLDRCPSLDVLLEGSTGIATDGLLVVVESDGGLFSAPARLQGAAGLTTFSPDSMALEVGMSPMAGTSFTSSVGVNAQPSHGAASFRPDASGRVTLSMIVPHTPFDLSVQDAEGHIAWGPDTLVLADGEARTVRVAIDHEPRDLTVRVTDPEGRPLGGAHIDVLHNGRSSPTQPATRADGTVVLRRIYASSVSLLVDRDGYVTRRVDGIVVAAGRCEVVLAPGREVHVRVRDAQARPALASTVRARFEDGPVGRTTPEPCADDDGSIAGSCWLCRDLPPGILTFEAIVSGRAFLASQSSDVAEVEIVVPTVGGLTVQLAVPRDDATLLIEPADAKGVMIEHSIGLPDWASGETKVSGLLPGTYQLTLVQQSSGLPIAGPQRAVVVAEVDSAVTLGP